MPKSLSTNRPSELFRVHIRPGGGLADASVSFDYCLREQVLGLGWQVDFPAQGARTWDTYNSLATRKFSAPELSRVRFLHDNLQPGDLVWTRDSRGKYYLAKALAPWEYHDAPGSADADVVNVVRCRILPVEQVDDVPGDVINCFRPSRAIQGIRKATAISYSQLLWNQLSDSNDYEPPQGTVSELFSFLAAETVEDVLFIYLQTRGWLVIPHSRKADSMGFEFILIHARSKKRAVVQVKTGLAPLNPQDWKNFSDEVFLFQANGIYEGLGFPGVTCLEPEGIRTFITKNLDIVPKSVQRWVAHLSGNALKAA